MTFFPGKNSGKQTCKLIKLELKFKRAHPTRAKIKAMKSYKNLDAICTMKRDHSSKIDQNHPNRTTCTKSILILKNHVLFSKFTFYNKLEGSRPSSSSSIYPNIIFQYIPISIKLWKFASKHCGHPALRSAWPLPP